MVVDLKESKISNIILMIVDALRADMISSEEYSENWPNLHGFMKKGMVFCSTASLTTPSVTSPRIKVCNFCKIYSVNSGNCNWYHSGVY